MIGRIERYGRKLRRAVSRNEWGARLLRLTRSPAPGTRPGLVMIQIDGLSRARLEQAIGSDRMPCLRRLLQCEGYRLYSHYSGLPTSTPAVQAELFYGVPCAVPSFSFIDHLTGRQCIMYQSAAAKEMERRLRLQAEGLLSGGSSYGNIFAGGAAEAHFCAVSLGWDTLWKKANLWRLTLLVASNLWTFAAIAVLLVVELFLTVSDFFRGVLAGADLKQELKFIPARLAVSILLRDLGTLGARIDIARGLPVIHLNLSGYDEQAHRRGPGSAFALWSLKGIDGCIRKIWGAARRAARRDYDVWIYSDHGQENCQSYPQKHGITVEEKIAQLYGEFRAGTSAITTRHRHSERATRAHLLGGGFWRWCCGSRHDGEPETAGLHVEALGPLGLIYLPDGMHEQDKLRFARLLAASGDIPFILVPLADGGVTAVTATMTGPLPELAPEILGRDHPRLTEVTEDLARLCRHPSAGAMVFSGWRSAGISDSYPVERGSHCGPGREETSAFALLPRDIPLPLPGKEYIRTVELREAALVFLERKKPAAAVRRYAEVADNRHIRVMTYNIHGCLGMDGKISPRRVARVLGMYRPDVVALQEVDMNRPRSGRADQAHTIARLLEMNHYFHPSIELEEERYGNAVLSRFPLRLVQHGLLPCAPPKKKQREPRSALWVELQVGTQRVQFIGTHFGLGVQEGRRQAATLCGPAWLGHPHCTGTVILAGDFNARPGSRSYTLLAGRFGAPQQGLSARCPPATFCSRVPLLRIDHIFVSRESTVIDVQVPRTALAAVASDHLPLIVDLRLPEPRRDQA